MRIIGEIIGDYTSKQKEIKDLNQGDLISLLINAAGEKLVDIYEIVLSKEKSWLESKVTLKGEFKIIKAVLEVNDISFLVEQAKSLTAKVKA